MKASDCSQDEFKAADCSNLAQLIGFLSSDDRNRMVLKQLMGFGDGRMNAMLKKRCVDEKAVVKKAALHLVSKLIGLFDGCIDGVLLKTIGMSCSDPLVSIRKAAISALSVAFRTFTDKSLTAEWLHSVPRLITDNESRIQEECENLFIELVLHRISRAGTVGSIQCDSNVKGKSLEGEIELLFPEGVLPLLKEICKERCRPG